jgi:hypothetical protein
MKIAIRFYKNGLKKAIINTLLFRIGVSVTVNSDEDLIEFIDHMGFICPKGRFPKTYPVHIIVGKYSRAIIWKRNTVKELDHAS